MKNLARIIIISVIAICSIVVAIYFIPFPEKICMNYYGTAMKEDGKEINDHEIKLTAIKYRYLLRDDTYHSLQLEVDGKVYDTSSYTSNIPFYEADDLGVSYEIVSYGFYNAASNNFRTCKLVLRDDYEWIGVWIEDYEPGRYYVGSKDSNCSPAQIWDILGSKLL